MNMHEVLKTFTKHVRETKGSGNALRFYVSCVQPIKEYFGGDEEVKKLDLPLVSKRVDIERRLLLTNFLIDYENRVSGEDTSRTWAEGVVDKFLKNY